MPTINFPKNALKSHKIVDVTQIYYLFASSDLPNGLVQVQAINTVNEGPAYNWRIVPEAYKPMLKTIFRRLELLKHAATDDTTKGENLRHIQCAQQNLVHLDMVLDSFWRETAIACKKNEMGRDWRSKTLDRWLCVEYFVRRHSPEAIAAWEARYPQNESALNGSIDTLGILRYVICHDFR